jgi:hypothetical protein
VIAASLFLARLFPVRVVLFVMRFPVLVADWLLRGLSQVRLKDESRAADHEPVG